MAGSPSFDTINRFFNAEVLLGYFMWDNWGEQSLLYSFLQEKSEKLVREDAQLLDVAVILSLYIFFLF